MLRLIKHRSLAYISNTWGNKNRESGEGWDDGNVISGDGWNELWSVEPG